jgi:hypothetical protein
LERPSYIYASALTRRERAWRGRRRQASGAFTTTVVSALLAVSALAAFIAHLFGA